MSKRKSLLATQEIGCIALLCSLRFGAQKLLNDFYVNRKKKKSVEAI